MFRDDYREIFDKAAPDSQLVADTLALKRVSKGYKSRRTARLIAIPTSAAASLLIAFTLLVNLSPAAALAFEQIPILRELAATVSFSHQSLSDTAAFSPSLSAAVEHDYFQHIGQEETNNDITMRVEYVIADKLQLYVFYTLQSERFADMFARNIALYDAHGAPLEGYGVHVARSLQGYWDGDIQQDDLRLAIFVFSDMEVPDSLVIRCDIIDIVYSEHVPVYEEATASTSHWVQLPVATFSIPFSFDSGMIPHTETILVNQRFTLDDQSLTVTSLDISPTHTRVNIVEDVSNVAWLRALSLHLVDENGVRFEQTGYCFDDTSLGKEVYRLESVFFAESQSLTLVITGAMWLDKDAEYSITVDLVNRTAENLPWNARLLHIGLVDNDFVLSFTAPNREPMFHDPFFEDMGRHMYPLFELGFLDEAGNERTFACGGFLSERYEIWDSPCAWEIFLSPEAYERLVETEELLSQQIPGYRQGLPLYYQQVDTPGWFGLVYYLSDYPYDVLYLRPYFSRISTLSEPIEIVVR